MCPRTNVITADSWCAPPAARRRCPATARTGMTLVELMIAMVLMATMTGVLATLALAMRQGWEHNSGHALAAQHARVAMERISRAVSTATANEDMPGFYVVYETVGTDRYPDTLVVWKPTGPATSPTGLPRIKECIFFCPDPAAPNRLLEITAPNDNRTIPLTESLNSALWRNNLAALKVASTSKKTVLTDLLRTATPTSSSTKRGVVRFEHDMRPTWQDWYNASITWSNLAWPQDLYSQDTGVRQAWVKIELQLSPGTTETALANNSVVPFFGSAVLTYTMQRADR